MKKITLSRLNHLPHTPQNLPIFIYGVVDYKQMVDNLSKAIEDENCQCKILSNYTVKVTTQHPDIYRTLIRHLHSEHTIHHTYQMKHDRAYRVVIWDLHYSIPITDIKDELQKLGHPICNII